MARARRRLTRPRQTTFLVALLVALLGVALYLNVLRVPQLQGYAFWIEVVAFAILALGISAEGI